MKYESNFALLTNQKGSGEEFNKVLTEWRKDNHLNENGFKIMLRLLEEYFGVGGDDSPVPLSPVEIEEYKKAFMAYDKSLQSEYGDYSPITMKSTSILARHVGAGWTSMSHTAVAIPVYSIGVNSVAFSTNLDNTDILRPFRAWRFMLLINPAFHAVLIDYSTFSAKKVV
jgi:alkaline phosphatase